MDLRFYRALFPGRHVVLGLELPPLSYWHKLLLQALESPFGTMQGSIGIGDLQLAVRIAQTRWPHPPELQRTMGEAWENWRRGRDRAFVHAQAEAFAGWLTAHEQHPDFWERGDGCLPKILTAPAILTRVTRLMRAGFAHETAWNDVTPGYAAWLLATVQEDSGAELRFVRDEDEEEAEDAPPDLTAMNDDELLAYLRGVMGEADARDFMAKRAAHLACRASVPDAEADDPPSHRDGLPSD